MNNLPVMLISAAVGGLLAGPVLAGMYDTVPARPARRGRLLVGTVPDAVCLYVAADRPAGPAPEPDREKQHQLHDRVLPHALAAAIVQILFWGVVILCMPLGLLLMLVFGFWFVTEVSCQIVYGDLDRVFHIEESIRKLKDAELEAALREDYADDDDPEE